MKEAFIKHLLVPLFGLIVIGIPIACSFYWDDFVSKKDYDEISEEKEEYVNYAYKFDSLLRVSEIERKIWESRFRAQNELLIDYIDKDRELTREGLIVIDDSLYSHTEFDSVLFNLRHGVN